LTKLTDIGEFGLIARFSPRFLSNLPAGVVGIGDDCAVLPWKKDARLLVTTDMLVEGIHFLRDRIRPRDLGAKSLAVNLSDIAAMGGKPDSAFLSLAIPRGTGVEWLDRLFKGIGDLTASENIHLLGGDTTRSPGPVVINIAVLGRVHPARVKFRSGARPGDEVCVTGFLGDSGGGLRVLLENRRQGRDEAYLVRRHNRPRAHLAEGAWLAGKKGVTAMMDVSDGIDSDLRRIMERSGCGAAVELEELPLSGPLRRAAAVRGWNLYEVAATGGEDYCLVATVRPDCLPGIARGFERKFGRRLSRIGSITGERGKLRYRLNGNPAVLGRHGFDHFR